ncbi:LTA synthase family protein [Marinobacter fonticola]|uniref:LTA synthase family protein n=1 Tax=Marinobacter fonticola TaxID=2603215 RepID=UPI001930EE21|nr:LTA synthase family protein [Marinobacter fonticola]
MSNQVQSHAGSITHTGNPVEAQSFVSRLYRPFRGGGAYTPLLMLFCAILLIGSLSRLLLVIWKADRFADTGIGATLFLQGLRVDAIAAGMAVAVPLLLLPLLAHRFGWPAWRRFSYIWALIMVFAVLFMELATPPFIAQYDVRPNRLFIEYLKYPQEVLATLWHGFRLPVLLGSGLCILLTALFARLLRPWLREQRRPAYKWTLMAWPVAVLAVFMSIRSTTDHRPANPAMFALTSDALVNSLILNSAWSVGFALYNLKHEAQASEAYGALKPQAMLDEIRNAPWLRGADFPSEQYPTLHYQAATVERKRPLNLVIILEESLGATFVKSLGGVPVTPNLETLKDQGWWFENLYATGTRSVRGIEAVVSGYLPSPARSVVKLSLSQNHFFTLAGLLREQGYDTGFVYGGEAHFDNMRSFFTGNGFEQIIDQSDYIDPAFTGSWGVSDEDLFAMADKQLAALHQTGKPFFRLVFTSSNHTPFEFPDGRIDLHDADKQTVNNAVKYADYALGGFIAQARQRDYWKDTLFLVVADHDDRVWGNELVPIKNFHIPGLILGADTQPKRVGTLASQIDLAPTLLSLMGVSATHPMIGRDLTLPDEAPGRAMMQFYDNYAWLTANNDVTVLRRDQPPLKGHYDPRAGITNYLRQAPGEASVREAKAHAMLPLWLYRERKYPGAEDIAP